MIGRQLLDREIPPEWARQGMVQHGFPEAFADSFLTLQATRRWYRRWHATDVAGLPKHRLECFG